MKYENWSLGYWLLKQYVHFACWLIHKRIVVIGRENIPRHKPLIFAPNHQNALSDPMAVLLNTRYQPVWLARADLFGKSALTDGILKFLKIVPVYRLRDGKENLDKNQDTFSTSVKVLKNNKALALFPEAAHNFRRQMLPHKKAVPRIAFMAQEQIGQQPDIQIIPTGIYYSHYWKFNRTLLVNFGAPISVNKFMDTYNENQNTAVIALKKELHKSILPLIVNIHSKKHYHDFERIRELYGKHHLLLQNKKHTEREQFKSDQILVGKLDKLEIADGRLTERITADANRLLEKIAGLGLRTWLLEKKEKHGVKLFFHSLILLAGLPLFAFGFVFNAVPFFLIDYLVRKKIRDKSFWSTFFLVSGIIVFPLFYLIETLALFWLYKGILLSIVFLASLPFAGKLAFNWYILLKKTNGRLKLLKLKWFNKTEYSQLIKDREQLFTELDALILQR